MKKTIITITMLIAIVFSIEAKPNIKLTVGCEYSYDTNIFSNPLPTYEAPKRDNEGNIIVPHVFPWLEWRADNPFVKKHSIGANLSLDIFFNEKARTGISTSLNVKHPLQATSFTPTPKTSEGFDGNWDYIESNSIDKQKTAVFWGIGPIFMAQFNFVDIGCAIRFSLGGYDYTDNEIIMGIQAEPFAHFYIYDDLYINVKLTYDAHLMRFINNESTDLYTPHYQMVSVAPSIGIGYRF